MGSAGGGHGLTMDAPTLVTVRFKSARAGLCGCHYTGINYSVPAAFAKQVVETERVAEYVKAEAPKASATGAKKK